MIRALLPSDAVALRAIRLEMLERHPDNFYARYADEAGQPLSFFEDMLRAMQVFGVFDGDALVGTAAWYGNRHGLPELTLVYLREDARGQGMAAALLEHAVGNARAAGHDTMMLQVNSGAGPAVRAYERLGFVAAPERADLRSGCDMVMLKPL